jgi:hypothetical protein
MKARFKMKKDVTVIMSIPNCADKRTVDNLSNLFSSLDNVLKKQEVKTEEEKAIDKLSEKLRKRGCNE